VSIPDLPGRGTYGANVSVRTRIAVVLAVACGLGSAAGVGPSAGAQPPDPDRAEREAAEAAAALEYATDQAQEAAGALASAEAELPAAEERLERARAEVVVARARSRTAAREADRAETDLTIAEGAADRAVEEVERAREHAAGFVVAAYKSSRLTGIRIMLRAEGPADVVRRLGYLQHVAGVEREAVDELVGARLAARQAENDATIAQERAAEAELAAEAALADAETAETEAEVAADEAAALVETRTEALEIAEAERDENLILFEEAEAEAERVAEELREWERRQREQSQREQSQPEPPEGNQPDGNQRAPGSGFLMPTQGWISSPFGMRFDPFFQVWQLHAGVDIAAPSGNPIYAVANGTVIRAGWNGGYGNFTCLAHGTYHGQALSTCYAHQSAILVGPGQWVGAGEVIGRVGTTGASTGYHLHFEVRLDGTPTDPMPFLP
jgi:murein DD-endopeptidase MepM/ murein hydrolase activator NlpD